MRSQRRTRIRGLQMVYLLPTVCVCVQMACPQQRTEVPKVAHEGQRDTPHLLVCQSEIHQTDQRWYQSQMPMVPRSEADQHPRAHHIGLGRVGSSHPGQRKRRRTEYQIAPLDPTVKYNPHMPVEALNQQLETVAQETNSVSIKRLLDTAYHTMHTIPHHKGWESRVARPGVEANMPTGFFQGVHVFEPNNLAHVQDTGHCTFISWNPGALSKRRPDVNRQIRLVLNYNIACIPRGRKGRMVCHGRPKQHLKLVHGLWQLAPADPII